MTKALILLIITVLLLSLSMATATAHPMEKSSEHKGQEVKAKESFSIRKFLNQLLLSASPVHVHSLEKGSEHAHKAETSSSIPFLRRLKEKKKTKKTTTKSSKVTAAPKTPTPKPTLPQPLGYTPQPIEFTFQGNQFQSLTIDKTGRYLLKALGARGAGKLIGWP